MKRYLEDETFKCKYCGHEYPTIFQSEEDDETCQYCEEEYFDEYLMDEY